MENLSKRISVELENIQRVLKEIPLDKPMSRFNPLELGGIAALILNFYNGIEKLKCHTT